MPRIWLATFAATGGITQWLGLINTNPTDALALRYAQLFLAASSFVALIAFARDGVRLGRQPSLRTCVNFAIPLIFALFIVKASLGGLDPAFRYGLALPAGLLGAAVLYSFDRTESKGDWGMLLVAAALAFYALGFALGVPAWKHSPRWLRCAAWHGTTADIFHSRKTRLRSLAGEVQPPLRSSH